MRKSIAELGAVLHPQPAEGGYLTLHDAGGTAGNSTWHLEWVKDNAVCHAYIPDSMTREAPEGRSLTILGQLLAAWQFIPNYSPTVGEWVLYINRWRDALGLAHRIPERISTADIIRQTYSTDITSEKKAQEVLRRWAEAAREV